MPCVRQLVRDELARLEARPDVLRTIDPIERGGLAVSPMECVSQGAALKAARISMPVSTAVSEGYGLVFSGEYLPLIPPNSMYPIDGSKTLTFSDINAKHLRIHLAAKSIDIVRSADKSAFNYEDIGEFSISLSSRGDLPTLSVSISIERNKRVTVTLIHVQSGQRVTYANPHLLRSGVTELKEIADLKYWTRAEQQMFEGRFNKTRATWSIGEIDQLAALAQRLLEICSVHDDDNLRVHARTLQEKVDTVRIAGSDGATVLANGIREFIDMLRQPDIGVLSAREFTSYLNELDKIGAS
jgi:hypothetical protein